MDAWFNKKRFSAEIVKSGDSDTIIQVIPADYCKYQVVWEWALDEENLSEDEFLDFVVAWGVVQNFALEQHNAVQVTSVKPLVISPDSAELEIASEIVTLGIIRTGDKKALDLLLKEKRKYMNRGENGATL